MRLNDIAFYIALFFILGVGFASLELNIYLVAGLIAIALISNIYFKYKWLWLVPIIFLGFFYFHFYSSFTNQNIPYSEKQTFTGIVITDPKRKLTSQDFYLELEPPFGGEVHVYTQLYPEFQYGDFLKIDGTIKRSFNGIEAMTSFPKIELISSGHGSRFKEILFSIKHGLVTNIQKVLSGDKAALATGILLGERGEFSEEFKDAMNKSGTTHIVALSGFNISIIGILLMDLLVYFINRRKAFYISLSLIICFVLMTGAEASVVRAAFMGVIAMVAIQSGRVHSTRNAITLTAFIMILIDPTLLVFDVGFQLSFLALMGLIYIDPILRRMFKIERNAKLVWWKKNAIQTASAQIAVAPVALYVFHYLSPVGIISNVLILEFIPLTMGLAFLTAVLGFIFYPLSLVVGWLTSIFLGYEIFIINLFSFNWL